MNAPAGGPERVTVHYRGRVQGVGFRWRVCRAAAGRDVTGFVANLRDGRVLLVAEGVRAELDGFLADVAERLDEHISGAAALRAGATGEFSSFDVRRAPGR